MLRRTGFRAGSAGRQLLSLLLGTPALSIKTAQALTGKSYPAARSAVLACVDAGILRQNSKNRKSGIYVADDVVAAFNAYERSLATLSGDTSSEMACTREAWQTGSSATMSTRGATARPLMPGRSTT